MNWERWTKEDWARAQELLADHPPAVVAPRLNRTVSSLKEKMRWEGMSPEQRQQRRLKMNQRRKAETMERKLARLESRRTERMAPDPVTSGPKLSAAAIADRNARFAASHRSLTAAFCGDPLPGYSALDQRAAQ